MRPLKIAASVFDTITAVSSHASLNVADEFLARYGLLEPHVSDAQRLSRYNKFVKLQFGQLVTEDQKALYM